MAKLKLTMVPTQISKYAHSIEEASEIAVSQGISLCRFALNPLFEVCRFWNSDIQKNQLIKIPFSKFSSAINPQTLHKEIEKLLCMKAVQRKISFEELVSISS